MKTLTIILYLATILSYTMVPLTLKHEWLLVFISVSCLLLWVLLRTHGGYRYRVWKKSITEYNVLDTVTGELFTITNFELHGCRFRVDVDKYHLARALDFKNTGDTFDYFAWIEAKEFKQSYTGIDTESVVFYNPFKNIYFRDRVTEKIVTHASVVRVSGNYLEYNH
jgi:hypothetical protein